MGLIASVGRPGHAEGGESDPRADRRLRSRQPGSLISGPAGTETAVRVQACMALGAGLIGGMTWMLPHPPHWNVAGLAAVQGIAVCFGLWGLLLPRRIPSWLPRVGPGLAAVLTTFAVILSGDSTSGFVMFYFWIGLYAFYFPSTRAEVVVNILFALACYGVAIAVTSGPPPASASVNADIHYFVIAAGTLLVAGAVLTYLRDRMERLLSRLTDAARTDPLTGMPNRVALQETVGREIARAEPERRPVSLIVLDIDRFKRVNDRLGTGAGDQALRRLGKELEDSIRLMDTAIHAGGGEFAVVLPEVEEHDAFLRAEETSSRLRRALQNVDPELTASIGVASFPKHGGDPQGLLRAAEQAMHAAKTLGGGRAVIFSPHVTSTLGVAAGRRSIERQAHLATALGLAEALDQRDPSTASHSQTVGRLCEAMARELGFAEKKVERVRLAGVLHDIGKVGVPDSILRKAGPLTDEERSQMRRHPELGARILASKDMDDVRSWVIAHHERPDGTGYPKGLSGDQIPIEASILAVADAFEAMTSDRVYRLALGSERAREELRRYAGTQFDRKVVEALLRALDRDAALVEL